MSEESVPPLKRNSMDEKPCCSTSASRSPGAVMERSSKLIGTGKRHLVMGDVMSAVGVFQEACAMLAKRYGDTADECGEAFFLYGKALLELARLENTVLGNALDGVPEEESEEGEKPDDFNIESTDNVKEETRDELREQVYDAMSEREAEKSEKEDCNKESETRVEKEKSVPNSPAKGETRSPVKDCDSSQKDEMTSEGSKKSSEEQNREELESSLKEEKTPSEEQREEEEDEKMEKGEEEEDDDDAEGDDAAEDKENEEEVGNLQLAWEMLEVAKVIYKRKGNKEEQLMAAQAHLKLGEVSVESGNYSQALEDFQECLAIQLKHLPPHSRMLAETHYQLGLTFGYTNQYSEAIQHFNSSIEVIESRLVTLQEVTDKAQEAESTVEEQKEIDELKQLLPDIREKVEDAQESQKTAVTASEAIQQTLAGCSSKFTTENYGTSSSMATTSADGASTLTSASDISHLVRKKRKPEESPLKSGEAKKTKQEAALNGSEDSSSGGQEKMEQEEHEKPASPVETSS